MSEREKQLLHPHQTLDKIIQLDHDEPTLPPLAELAPTVHPAGVGSKTGQLDAPSLNKGPLHHFQEAAGVFGFGGVAAREDHCR